LFLLLACCFLSQLTEAQIVFSGTKWTIGSLQVDDCSYQLHGLTAPSFIGDVYNDVALTPDGRILAVRELNQPEEDIKESYLIAINPDDVLDSDTLLTIEGVTITALTCTTDYTVYLGGSSIRTYNLLTEELTDLGTTPPTFFTTDLVWFEGELYGCGTWFDFGNNIPPRFIRFGGLDDGTISVNSPTITEDFPLFSGLANVYDYENERLRMIACSGERATNSAERDTSRVYEVFLEDTTYTQLCEIVMEPGDRFMAGLAGADEFRSNFQLQLDLDVDDSSGRFIDHHQADGLCTRVFPLADEDVHIRAPLAGVDSLVVNLATGVHPAGEETIRAESLPGFQITGNQSPYLLVVPDDATNIAVLENFIAQIQLEIAGTVLQTGERRVDFRLYSGGQASDAAMAFVYPQPDIVPYAGEDYSIGSCPIDNLSLFAGLGENVYPDGYWSPALFAGDGTYQTGLDEPGLYYYITQEGSCGPDTASVTVFEFPQLVTNYGGELDDVQVIYFCPGDTITWGADTAALLNWEWDVAPYSSPAITITEAGAYGLLAIDTNGCDYYMRTFFREPEWEEDGPGMLVDTVSRCEGALLSFFGTSVSSDTTICVVIPSTSDCDLTHCRTFEFAPDVEQIDTVSICEGEVYHWQGQSYTEAGTYEAMVEGAFSCDSLLQLDLRIDPVYERNLIVNLTPGGSFAVGDSVLTEAGFYSILLASSQGCDSLINITVEAPNVTFNPLQANCVIPNLLQKGQNDWQVDCPAEIQIKEWAIYDLQGRCLKKASFTADDRILLTRQEQLYLPAGLYFYRLEYEWEGQQKQHAGKLVLVGR
ncbi:MAG: T9SS type A sorting domain-containing protein, partial [Bacteroidota bacterium]